MYETWEERFELAKKYYEHYGHLRVKASFKTKDGITYDEEGFKLGRWIHAQRSQYKIGELTKIHSEKLKSIGMIFENVNDLCWDEFYECLKKYKEYYGDIFVQKGFKTKNGVDRDNEGKDLGSWLVVQRRQYKEGTLSLERKQKLDVLGDVLGSYDEMEWEEMYSLAHSYYEHHKNLDVPNGFKTKNGHKYSKDGKNLYNWLGSQRIKFQNKELSKEKIEKLEKIGMIFENLVDYRWQRMYSLAKVYYEHNGNLKVHRQFKTKNGITYDEKGYNLGKWLNGQYSMYVKGNLSKEKIEKLQKIGMIFYNQTEKSWEEMYSLAEKYYEHHKNLDVGVSFKTINGYDYNEKGKPLGMWLSKQRAQFKKGSYNEEHRKKLEKIGAVFDKKNYLDWNQMYLLLKAYYKHNGNLEIPLNFKTNDGYTYNEDGKNLYTWLQRQQVSYNSKVLSRERKLKLEALGMQAKNVHDDNWNQMYELAKAYYLHYFNLKVNVKFKTNDGITYSEDGKNLGYWISSQKAKYKSGTLSEIRIKKLELIGMVFEISKNKQQNECVCLAYDIDYQKYKRQIDAIPYREFIVKINYLNQNGIPFVINNQLNPIFFISSMNMEVRYGLSLEQMILNYENQTQKSKQITKMIKMGV